MVLLKNGLEVIPADELLQSWSGVGDKECVNMLEAL